MKLKLIFFLIAVTLSGLVRAQGLRVTLNKVMQDYFNTQKAIVAGNAALVTEKSQAFIWDLRAIPVNEMTDAQHRAWFSHMDKLMAASRGISQGHNLDAQKQQYSELSKQFFETLKLFKVNKGTVYKISCNGYTWLSQTSAINNPYVSKTDKNKRCGNIDDLLKGGK